MNGVQWFAAYYQEKYSTHYSWNLSPPKIFVFSMMLKNDSWVVSTSGTEVYCTINCIFVVECWHLLFVLASPCHTSDKQEFTLKQINCPKGVAAGAYLGQVVRKLHIKSLYMFINCFCQMAAGTRLYSEFQVISKITEFVMNGYDRMLLKTVSIAALWLPHYDLAKMIEKKGKGPCSSK